jgi:hypothetical protein
METSKEVKLEKGNLLLGQAAADAIRQWHFSALCNQR